MKSGSVLRRYRPVAPIAIAVLAGGALAGAGAQAHGAGARTSAVAARNLRVAHASRTLSVNDTGHLHLLKAFGSVLLEEGYAGGTLPGRTRVRMVVGSSVSATFSIRAHGGTIYGRGGATLHSSGRYASFGGWLRVSNGSGRFAQARGRGWLYGVIDRRTDALTVQTRGALRY